MKVKFEDCEFGCFEPHREIEYNGKKYRAIDVDLVLEDGTEESHTISEYALEQELFKDFNRDIDNSDIDNEISYYAENNDGVYYVLEQITGEEIS